MTPPRHVHFIGIGGIHMSGLARILLAEGDMVSGSDLVAGHLTDALAAQGARIFIGHDAGQVAGAELVVRTMAVKETNPEVLAAQQQGIELISRAQMVARLAAGRRTLTVAGTHGKTTTAAMLTLILQEAGLEPSFLLGGESADLGGQAAKGRGDLIVIEADEYARAFQEYTPKIAVMTNIESDHLDYYKSEAALREAFLQYAQTLLPQGILLIGGDDRGATAVAERVRPERPDIAVQTFGLGPEAGWRARDVEVGEGPTHFRVDRAGDTVGRFELRVPGEFNVRNATAAIAAGMLAGATVEAAQRALARFRGVRRRFQVLGEAGGVLVVDDYAHHPTEIAATIAAARQRYPARRLVALFQPHTYSRSAYLREGFRTCFQGVDRLYLTDTYAAREEPEAGLSAVDLAAEITQPGAIYVGSLPEAVEAVSEKLQPGDILVTMGAGDIEQAGPQILERVRAQ